MKRRILMVSGLLLLMFGFTAPAASAQVEDCSDYISESIDLYLACAGGPQITVNPGTTTPGGTITVDLSGWLPGSSVTVSILCNGTQITLGNVSIGEGATGQGVFTVPSTCPNGPTSVSAAGFDMKNDPATVEGAVVINSVPTNLPLTGSDTGKLVTTGAALVVIGAAALYGSLRGRRRTEEA